MAASRSGSAALVIAAAIAIGPVAFPAAAASPPANVDVSRAPARVHQTPTIAVDRTNPLRLVVAAEQDSLGKNAVLFWSADAGNSWGSVQMPSLPGLEAHSHPSVAWDSRGIAYAVARVRGGNPYFQIHLVRSADGGRTWSDPPTVVAAHLGPGSSEKPLMAINDQPATPCQDLVCVAWDDFLPSTTELKIACATEGQGPWAETRIATGDLLWGAAPAFGPAGELYVAWTDWDQSSIQIVRSDDCGRTFGAPIPITTDVAGLNHRFAVAGFQIPLPASCSNWPAIYPAIDVDRSFGPERGAVYASWLDGDPGADCSPDSGCPGTCTSNVYFASSLDGGLTWSAPLTVHDDLPLTDQFNPWLAVNDWDGSINVMWYDTRNDAGRTATEVWYRRSRDGGAAWEPELLVSSMATDESEPGADPNAYGTYAGIAAFDCGVWPVWTARRPGASEQIYTALVHPDGGVDVPADLGNRLRAVPDAAGRVQLAWTDLGGSEVSYRVYRSADRDFAAGASELIGASGGGDVNSYTDPLTPAGPGVSFYKVRAVGPCGEEPPGW